MMWTIVENWRRFVECHTYTYTNTYTLPISPCLSVPGTNHSVCWPRTDVQHMPISCCWSVLEGVHCYRVYTSYGVEPMDLSVLCCLSVLESVHNWGIYNVYVLELMYSQFFLFICTGESTPCIQSTDRCTGEVLLVYVYWRMYTYTSHACFRFTHTHKSAHVDKFIHMISQRRAKKEKRTAKSG